MCSLKRSSSGKLQSLSLDGGALKDFLEYMEMAPVGAATDDIQELKGVMRRQPVDHKRGPFAKRILKLLVYGGQLIPVKLRKYCAH